jgi:hypothetical protein
MCGFLGERNADPVPDNPNTPQGGINTFTKFIHTLFSTPLRGEKQEINF